MKQCVRCNRFFDVPAPERCPHDDHELEPVTSTRETRDPLIGARIDGRFEIVRRLGQGGMGAVYEAIQTSVERAVAVKVIKGEADPQTAKRFLLEAKLTSALRSPHTVTVLDFGRDGDRLYLAMELLEGRSLDAHLKRHGALPWRVALHVARQVARSLEEAHGRGIVHRDLKPANIFITPAPGDPWFVKVLDFGIGKVVGTEISVTSLTDSGGVVGSPAYLAPEQAQAGEVDGRTDLYTLGCVLYEMLTGRRPFQASTAVRVVMMHMSEPPPALDPAPEDAPDEVHALVFSLLQKRPEDRPDSARELAERIDQCLDGGETAVGALDAPTTVDASPPPPTPPRRWGWLVVLALLIAGIGVALKTGMPDAPAPRDAAAPAVSTAPDPPPPVTVTPPDAAAPADAEAAVVDATDPPPGPPDVVPTPDVVPPTLDVGPAPPKRPKKKKQRKLIGY